MIPWAGSVQCKAAQAVKEDKEGIQKVSNTIEHKLTIKVVCKDDVIEDVFERINEHITDDEPVLTMTMTGSKIDLEAQLKTIGSALSELGGQKTLDMGY